MLTRKDRLVAAETLFLGGALVAVVRLGSTALWLLWAATTVAIAGATLLAFNRGLDPAGRE